MSEVRSIPRRGLALLSGAACADSKNGFDLTNSLVPADDVLSGGPQRDGIPAIDQPIFLSGSDDRALKPESEILRITCNGVSNAYSIAILDWHEISNDRFGDDAVEVTYCPLCGSGVAFLADKRDAKHGFGVSGLLYNSDVLLHDRATERCCR